MPSKRNKKEKQIIYFILVNDSYVMLNVKKEDTEEFEYALVSVFKQEYSTVHLYN